MSLTKKASRSATKPDQRQKSVIEEVPSNLTLQDVLLAISQASIVLYYQEKLDNNGEMIQKIKVGVNTNNEIDLRKLIQNLNEQGFLKDKYSLSYLSLQSSMRDDLSGEKGDVYVYCGDTARPEEFINIPRDDAINSENQITLKVRKNKKSLVDNLLEEQKVKSEKEPVGDDKGKTKEKKIGEVVEKVALWRRFYTGFYDERGNFIQKPLQSAATEVGIAKKTLDDYLLQIRCGKKYGFDFNSNVEGKIGELRAFVREAKKKQKKDHPA